MTWSVTWLALGVLAIAVGSVMGYALLRCPALENIEEAVRLFPASGEQHASDLLRDLLNAQENEQLTRCGFLDIRSPGRAQRIYRIPRYPGLVTVYEDGRAVGNLCVQPVDSLPSSDVILMHKLMIQACEAEYLATARQFPLLLPGQRYRPLPPILPMGEQPYGPPFTSDMSTFP